MAADDLIGLIPAAGLATRIAPLPMSKELFPIGFARAAGGEPLPQPVCCYLLAQMRRAGAGRAVIVLRAGKWDIPAYLGDGGRTGMALAYVVTAGTAGVAESIDLAQPFVRDARVAFGFADVVLTPDDVLARLRRRQDQGGADVVVAAYRARDPRLVGMIDIDPAGRVRRVIEKPAASTLTHMWIAALWRPRFTAFLHANLGAITAAKAATSTGRAGEVSASDALQAALDHGLAIEAEVIEDGSYRDIGTPRELMAAVAAHSGPHSAADSGADSGALTPMARGFGGARGQDDAGDG